MFKRILVALDGSPASNAGLNSALDLAADQQATLVALNVIDDNALPIGLDGSVHPAAYLDAYFAANERNGRKILDRAAAAARARGVKLEPVILRPQGGSVADVIVAQQRKLKADVIVLGTHGRRGLRRMLMGSDAEAVVRRAPVPVLLVRGTSRATRKARKSTAEASSTKRASAARAQPALAPI